MLLSSSSTSTTCGVLPAQYNTPCRYVVLLLHAGAPSQLRVGACAHFLLSQLLHPRVVCDGNNNNYNDDYSDDNNSSSARGTAARYANAAVAWLPRWLYKLFVCAVLVPACVRHTLALQRTAWVAATNSSSSSSAAHNDDAATTSTTTSSSDDKLSAPQPRDDGDMTQTTAAAATTTAAAAWHVQEQQPQRHDDYDDDVLAAHTTRHGASVTTLQCACLARELQRVLATRLAPSPSRLHTTTTTQSYHNDECRRECYDDDNDDMASVQVEVAYVHQRASVAAALARFALRGNYDHVVDTAGRAAVVREERLLVLPLYAQYSALHSGAAFDAVACGGPHTLQTMCTLPHVHFVRSFCAHARYVAALARHIRAHLAADAAAAQAAAAASLTQQPQQPSSSSSVVLCVVFAGAAEALYCGGGDCYAVECRRTYAALRAQLLRDDDDDDSDDDTLTENSSHTTLSPRSSHADGNDNGEVNTPPPPPPPAASSSFVSCRTAAYDEHDDVEHTRTTVALPPRGAVSTTTWRQCDTYTLRASDVVSGYLPPQSQSQRPYGNNNNNTTTATMHRHKHALQPLVHDVLDALTASTTHDTTATTTTAGNDAAAPAALRTLYLFCASALVDEAKVLCAMQRLASQQRARGVWRRVVCIASPLATAASRRACAHALADVLLEHM